MAGGFALARGPVTVTLGEGLLASPAMPGLFLTLAAIPRRVAFNDLVHHRGQLSA